MNDIITREEYIAEMKQNWGEPSFETCSSCGHDKICHYEFWKNSTSPYDEPDKEHACDMITCKCERFTQCQ
jgi:hypothetical protein